MGDFWVLERRKHARKHLESKIFLITQPVRAPLDYANLVVQALDESQRYLVLRPAVSSDPIPMSIDHRGEFLERLEPLPLQAVAPVLEEFARPPFAFVIPQLTERLLEQVCRVQPLVGRDDPRPPVGRR